MKIHKARRAENFSGLLHCSERKRNFSAFKEIFPRLKPLDLHETILDNILAVYGVIKKISRELFDESHYSVGLNRDPRFPKT